LGLSTPTNNVQISSKFNKDFLTNFDQYIKASTGLKKNILENSFDPITPNHEWQFDEEDFGPDLNTKLEQIQREEEVQHINEIEHLGFVNSLSKSDQNKVCNK